MPDAAINLLYECFNTQPREGGCVSESIEKTKEAIVSTHSRAKAAAKEIGIVVQMVHVSTHSRAKAAAGERTLNDEQRDSFNTQPREGGCRRNCALLKSHNVSTHSRAKAAAKTSIGFLRCNFVSTHSRAKAAAVNKVIPEFLTWSFNTQPREGGCFRDTRIIKRLLLFQHTAARRRLQPFAVFLLKRQMFQHTAARRRLPPRTRYHKPSDLVSTHSRAKAAATG